MNLNTTDNSIFLIKRLILGHLEIYFYMLNKIFLKDLLISLEGIKIMLSMRSQKP